ncbi:uncharacterized protein SAPINGB_P005185 [Magnusiomyces paraingens]|uniref:Importin N-terminal domain-containing protein n=1 Tax=Magnusiomyces paraingens TaxID=2606893 RepID=A0A5E8C488_9ASCO|nr:uncharacterized protein SAPINGB_P005185 [Saprochaete ingens]VVT56628.1 unnamed protein product [Saprochaete ingens]
MSSWTPELQSLQELGLIFGKSLSSNNADQQEAIKALKQVETLPELNRYLVYMLIQRDAGFPTQVRTVAGVKLKNNILQNLTLLDGQTVAYIKSQIVNGLSDPEQLVRNVTGNVITSLVTQLHIDGWPEILPELMSLVESSNETIVQESSLSALAKICEDSAASLDKEYAGQRPLDYMIPKFLEFATYQSQRVRALSIQCITQFVINKSQSLLPYLDAFLNTLFTLTSDNYAETKINICTALVNIMYTAPEKLVPHLEGVVNYVIHCMLEPDERVSCEAGEFILQMAEANNSFDDHTIERFLPTIVPTVLKTMVYSENDRILLKSLAEDDQDIEDRPEDIKPQFAKAKEHKPVNSSDKSHTPAHQLNEDDNYDDDDDEDDEDEDDAANEALSEWNLRKGSAATLDVLSTKFPNAVLELALPHLQTSLLSNEWFVLEAAILAFGAISQGCIELLSPNLSELIPFLVQQLKNPEPAVRQISCWTLSRYGSWIAIHSIGDHKTFLQPVLRGLLDCCLDKNKKVQEAACSACSILTEEAGDELVPYLEPILRQYAEALRRFRTKNRLNLYDSIQTLFDKIGESASSQSNAEIIVPGLHERWMATRDDDPDLWQLMECLSTVTAYLGMYMTAQLPDMYKRCIRLISDSIIMEQNYQYDDTIEIPDKEFQITALDLVDGIVLGVKENMAELTQRVQPNLVELLIACFDDEVFEVRQSALAVVGDLAIHAIDVLLPQMNAMMEGLLKQMSMEYTPGVCNNAIWSAGEIALKLKDGDALKPYVEALFTRLWEVLDSNTAISTVWENAATAIGRMGQAVPEMLGPHVGLIIYKWCYHIAEMGENEEKDSAYLGMCKIVQANPGGISNEQHLLKLIELLALYMEPSQELAENILLILQGYKQMVPDWNSFVAKLPEDAQNSIKQRYRV